MFFAAVSSVYGGDDFRDVALRTIAPLRADIHRITANPTRRQRVQQPIGGLTGLGSIIYSLVRIGDLLVDDSILDDAHLAATILTADRVATDEELDVMVGSAGALLALLALDERRPGRILSGEPPIELALRCARHLLRTDTWATSEGRGADGFCHGRAGIYAALAKLYERTGRHQLRTVSQQYSASDCYSPYSWCKGAAGIALGHVSMSRTRSQDLPAEEARSWLELAAAPSLSRTDDLCCGNSGRVDVLVHAARILREPNYLDKATNLASSVLERAQRQGRYSLKLTQEAGVDLRLFPGIAGIGYSLLRLEAADRVPCVLAME